MDKQTKRTLRQIVAAFMFMFWFIIAGTPAFCAAVPVDVLWAGLFDNSGQPLAGGKVYTYAAGSTTNKATYADSAKSTTNANPVVLDAYGRAAVYADGAYKFVIKNADDVTLVTIDNLEFVSAQNPSTLSTTALSATGATIGSLTANIGVLTNMTISSATITLANLISPNISNASMTGSLHSPTINTPSIVNASMTGSLHSPNIYNASLTGSLYGPTITNATITSPAIVGGTITGGTMAPATFTFPVNYAFVIATPTANTDPANKGYVDARVLDAALPSTNNIYVAGASMTFAYTSIPVSSYTLTAIPNSGVAFNNTSADKYVVSADISFSVLAYGGQEYTIMVTDESGNIYDGIVVEHGESAVYRKMPARLGFKATVASGTSKTFSLTMFTDYTDAAVWIYHYNRGGTLATAWQYITWSGS